MNLLDRIIKAYKSFSLNTEKVEKTQMLFVRESAYGTKQSNGFLFEEYSDRFKNKYERYALFMRMDNDGQVFQMRQAISLMKTSTQFFVDPYTEDGMEANQRDIQIAKFVEKCLFENLDKWFKGLIEDISLYVRDGFSLFELYFEKKDDGYYPQLTRMRAETVFKWRTSQDEPWIQQITYYPKGKNETTDTEANEWSTTIDIPWYKLVLFNINAEWDNFEWRGLYRKIAKDRFFKDRFENYHAVLQERLSVPPLKVKVPQGTASNQIEEYKNIAENMRSLESGYVTEYLDENGNALVGYEWMETKIGENANKLTDAIKHYQQNINDIFFEQFLYLGKSEKGSYGMAGASTTFFFEAVKGLLERDMEVINKYIIPKIVALNFGEAKRMPKIKFWQVGFVDPASFSTTLGGLVTAGLLTSNYETEKYVRELLHLPFISEEEYKETKSQATAEANGGDMTAVAEADAWETADLENMEDVEIDDSELGNLENELDNLGENADFTAIWEDVVQIFTDFVDQLEFRAPMTEETRKKISEALKKKWWTAEVEDVKTRTSWMLESVNDEVNQARDDFNNKVSSIKDGITKLKDSIKKWNKAQVKKQIKELQKQAKEARAKQKEFMAKKKEQKKMLNLVKQEANKEIRARKKEESAKNKEAKKAESERKKQERETAKADRVAKSEADKAHKGDIKASEELMAKLFAEGMTTQSILFDKEHFTLEQAKKWLKDHDYKTDVDEKPDTYRFRQRDPKDFQEGSMRTIQIKTGIKMIVGKLKGTKNHSGCECGECDFTAEYKFDHQAIIDHQTYWVPEQESVGMRNFADPIQEWFRRPLTFAERRVAVKSIKDNMKTEQEELMKKYSEISDNIKTKMMASVQVAVENNDFTKLAELEAKYKSDISALVTATYKKNFDYGKNEASREIGVQIPQTKKDLHDVIKIQADNIADGVTSKVTTEAKAVVSSAIAKADGLKNTSSASTVLAVKKAIEPVLDQAFGVVNTISIGQAFNSGRKSVAYINAPKIYGAQYSAILDDRTSDRCLSLDGTVVKVDSDDYKNYSPPQHINCRSMWVYINDDEEYKPDITDVDSDIPVKDTITSKETLKAPVIAKWSPAVKVIEWEISWRTAKNDSLAGKRKEKNQEIIARLKKSIE